MFRVRKVKCDEGRPSCKRCCSTGRTCDGYGIFGGGGKAYSPPSTQLKARSSTNSPKDIPWGTLSVCNSTATTEENSYYEWFQLQTSKKLPGIFASSFWDRLVFQASSVEPAVLHAVLALSSMQKREIHLGRDLRGRSERVLDAQEEFTLRQTSKAISHLQPHFTTKSRDSIHVALVTCVIFICLEYIRGHYKSAQVHLKNGFKAT